MLRKHACMAACTGLFLVGTAHAHDPGLSRLELQARGHDLTARLMLDRELAHSVFAAHGHPASESGLSKIEAGRALEIRLNDEIMEPVEAEVRVDGVEMCRIRLRFSLRNGGRLEVRSLLLPELPSGHRQYVSLTDTSGRVLSRGFLTAGDHILEATLSDPSRRGLGWHSFGEFLTLRLYPIVFVVCSAVVALLGSAWLAERGALR